MNELFSPTGLASPVLGVCTHAAKRAFSREIFHQDSPLLQALRTFLFSVAGAFLIPYFTMMLIQGIPLFIMEYALGQRMKQSAVRVWTNVHPVFFGVGLGCMLVSFAMCLYYIVIITWCVYYFFVSFTSNLPWQKHNCPAYSGYMALQNNYTWWTRQNQSLPWIKNETAIMKRKLDNYPDCCVRDPPVWYWYNKALVVSADIGSVGEGLNWKMTGCLFVGWVITYLCVIKGVKSSGKVSGTLLYYLKPQTSLP